LENDTVIFFTSDNGPHEEGQNRADFFKSSGPLRGIKRSLYDGGIREPMIVTWPGKIPAGRTSDHLWAFWDFLPTAAELAGATAPNNLDGISVVPILLEKPAREHDYLYWEFFEGGFKQAVRTQNWKAVKLGVNSPIELYDLSKDIGETTDVAGQHSDIVAKMQTIMTQARVDSPDWPVRR
jgi:arylsulfatase A-like enzyme